MSITIAGVFRTARADDEVVIRLKWLHQFQFAGYYAAIEQGFFREEGLQVTLEEYRPGQSSIQAVLAGDATYGVFDSMVLLAQARGEPLVLVTPIFQHSPNVLLTLADSGLDTPDALNGRRIAFYNSDAGGLSILAMLASQGVSQVSIEHRKASTNIDELTTGKVDAISAYATNQPFALQQKGYGVNLIYPRHYGFDPYGDMLFTSRAEAEQHPERVTAMRRAVLRGWEYALDHKAELVELIYQQYNTQSKTREALLHEAKGIDSLISRHTTALGSINHDRIDHILYRLQQADSLARGNVSPADFYWPDDDTGKLALSAKERAFLDTISPVRIGIPKGGRPPVEVFQNGALTGIVAEYLQRLEALLAIEFELVTQEHWQATLAQLKNRDIDMIPSAISTPDRRTYARFTMPYLRSPIVIVTRDDVSFIVSLAQLENKKLGVVVGHVSDELISRSYPDIEKTAFPSAEAGLQALSQGEIDAFIDSFAIINHLLTERPLTNLKISGQTPYDFDLRIGVRDDWPLLQRAIDKALRSIPQQVHKDIHNRWMPLELEQPSPWRQLFLPALVAVTAVTLIILMSYLWRLSHLNRRVQQANQRLADSRLTLRRKNQKLRQLSITDKLTGVYNRYHLDKTLSQQLEHAERYHRTLSLVLFDLDHFKEINDHYGHPAGDDVIQQFTRTVIENIRQSDIFGRWGGEEFLLICPETSAEQARQVAEKIRSLFAQQQIDTGMPVTVSAGVVDSCDATTVEQLISAADRRLYQAKAAGRNRVIATAACASPSANHK